MIIPRIAAALFLVGLGPVACAPTGTGVADPVSAATVVQASTPDGRTAAVARGQTLTAGTCASCHATGRAGDSPMAAATPFRVIVQRYPLDQLEEAFAEGLVTGHPAMPEFVFRASEIDDLMAYLQALKDQG